MVHTLKRDGIRERVQIADIQFGEEDTTAAGIIDQIAAFQLIVQAEGREGPGQVDRVGAVDDLAQIGNMSAGAAGVESFWRECPSYLLS
ncbi:MAG: hypothetical protein QNI85_08755 [Desulfobacterales bacterium]|nr:hypothetical protein [Desulfobacterales bacterium]